MLLIILLATTLSFIVGHCFAYVGSCRESKLLAFIGLVFLVNALWFGCCGLYYGFNIMKSL